MSDERPWERAHEWAAPMAKEGTGPLKGLRIVDFTRALAGPFCTMLLADLGADVIKVSTGSRSSGANSPSHAYFTSWNRNKRNITLDMSRPEGRAVARRLAQLLAAGCSLRVIDRRLAEISRLLPGVERPLADPRVVVAGRRLFLLTDNPTHNEIVKRIVNAVLLERHEGDAPATFSLPAGAERLTSAAARGSGTAAGAWTGS